jgi:hypothetical protein
MGAAANLKAAEQETLVRALFDPRCYPHPVGEVRLIQTHISYVLLTGQFAYKIKKPLDLDFLDFTTLAARRHFCEEELRLNRRLAPRIYVDVVAIGGTPDRPLLGAGEPAIEYALRMREFQQEALLDAMLARGELGAQHIDALAQKVAAFHGAVGRARTEDGYGSAAGIEAPMRQNFTQFASLPLDAEERHELAALAHWSRHEHAALRTVFEQRQRDGFIRECHGDLYLGNIALVEGEAEIFDCIEFNANLRWIDVMNEIAFLVMDLDERGRPDFAWRFLDGYLALTGDYAGVRLLRYYQVYRALVRAKVADMRAAQAHLSAEERNAALAACAAYIRHAFRTTGPSAPALIITHGLSGSGKTTLAQRLLEALGAVRVRSDVERKRLQGLAPAARTGSAVGAGIYERSATEATYEELARLARPIVETGYTAIVDATFLVRSQRRAFQQVAQELHIPFLIVDCRADMQALRRRIADRARTAGDASEATLAVLEHQHATAQPLDGDELHFAVSVDTQHLDMPELVQRIRSEIERARHP